jgi:hypothetical protein
MSELCLHRLDGLAARDRLACHRMPPHPGGGSAIGVRASAARASSADRGRRGRCGIATGLVAYLVAQDQYAGFEQRGSGKIRTGRWSTAVARGTTWTATTRCARCISWGLIGGSVLAVAGATVLVLTWQTEPNRSAPPKEPSLRVGSRFAALAGSF